jgi:hypothetical protein
MKLPINKYRRLAKPFVLLASLLVWLPYTTHAQEPNMFPPEREKVHIVLLAGQSNMAGRGLLEAEDRVVDPRILTLGEDLSWKVAAEPLHFDKPQVAGVGPGMAFARQWIKTLPDDHVIALVPTASGGTSILLWASDYEGDQTFHGGHSLYANAVLRTRAALEHGRLRAVLWNQGESDTRMDEETYRSHVHRLIKDLRADLGEPTLPFVAATLGPWRANAGASVNAVYRALPTEVPHTATVDTLHPSVRPLLLNRPDDPSHYTAASARLLGQLYAEHLLPLLPASLQSRPVAE